MAATGAPQKLDTMSVYIVADSDDEAAQLAIDQFKSAAVAKGCRGFSLPEVTHQDILLVDGEWKRAYEFTTEFLPDVVGERINTKGFYCVHGFTDHCAELAV